MSTDASRGETTPSREGSLDRREGSLLERVGCPAGVLVGIVLREEACLSVVVCAL